MVTYLHMGFIVAPIKVFVEGPCLVGSLETLAVAQSAFLTTLARPNDRVELHLP